MGAGIPGRPGHRAHRHPDKAIALYRHFGDRVNVGFGIGTSLTNGLGHQPLNIVMKVVQVNGQPVAKLSDAPGKALATDETFLAYLRQVFGVGLNPPVSADAAPP